MAEVVVASLTVAWRATWRFNVVLLVLFLPVGLVMAGIIALLAGLPLGCAIVVFLLVFPFSMLAHEMGHCLAAIRSLDSGGRHLVTANGGWLRAGIRRPAFSPRREVMFTVAGPVLGLVCSLPFLAAPPIEALILMTPFAVHLLALSPRSADGRAILELTDNRFKEPRNDERSFSYRSRGRL